MYKKIVVGYDGSERALRAVEQAADLATAVGSSVHIVTAVNKEEIHEFGSSSDKMYLSTTQIARDQLINIAAKLQHLNVSIAAVKGSPAQVLIKEASAIDADLIFVGNRNVQGIGRVLGSVAEDVAHKAPCAVLIAKTA
jgi:nucleotide-binding universal stress UspA family protein